MQFRLEICADSIESAITAQEAGAHRIELCDNLDEGGTTPGPGKILSARYNLNIDINVLIRPRGSDFLYTDAEYDIMRRDIDFCGESGIDGVVIGILKDDGTVDTDRTARLAESARPMSVTFHRAFDMCRDPLEGLEAVIKTGADRLLTSGQRNKAYEGLELIAALAAKAGSRIIIMPGSGLNEFNIEEVARSTGASEFHMTARKKADSLMKFRKNGITLGIITHAEDYSRRVADPSIIKKVIEILGTI